MTKKLKIKDKMYLVLADRNIDSFCVSDVRNHVRNPDVSANDGKNRQFLCQLFHIFKFKKLSEKKWQDYMRRITSLKKNLINKSIIKSKTSLLTSNNTHKQIIKHQGHHSSVSKRLIE